MNNDRHKKIMRTLSGFFVAIVFLVINTVVGHALAGNTLAIQPQTTQIQIGHATITNDDLKNEADMWGLTLKAYRRYVWLMKHTPSGRWYRNLDPAEVLAINAANDAEMMKYAKIQAKNMHLRVSRELAFDVMYAKAYRTLYPHEKPIMSSLVKESLSGAVLHSGDRIWLFTGLKTPLGHFVYQHLIQRVQKTPGVVLDIYFVGKNLDQKAIQHWAMDNGISPAMVNKQVTLNYGNKRFVSITKNKKSNLPLIGVLHQGHFQKVTLSSVL